MRAIEDEYVHKRKPSQMYEVPWQVTGWVRHRAP